MSDMPDTKSASGAAVVGAPADAVPAGRKGARGRPSVFGKHPYFPWNDVVTQSGTRSS